MTRFWTFYERTCQWLLLLPFLVVQLIGPGAMPQIGPEGIELVLCSDSELRTVTISVDGELIEDEPLAEHYSPCDWAIANGQLVEASPVTLPVREGVATPADHAFVVIAFAPEPAFGPPPARAPPLPI